MNYEVEFIMDIPWFYLLNSMVPKSVLYLIRKTEAFRR